MIQREDHLVSWMSPHDPPVWLQAVATSLGLHELLWTPVKESRRYGLSKHNKLETSTSSVLLTSYTQ